MPRAKKTALVEELDEQNVEFNKVTIEETPNFEVQKYTKEGEKIATEGKAGIVNCDYLNVRSNADITSEIVTIIPKNTELIVTGEEINGFYPVTDARDPVFKINGFVKKEFINLVV